ncbi:hypothetical protein JCM17846_04530 [Iodidimonas nitroreducens]|uniref:DUF1223 domain-containing protein n=1 Tax=Iodidimonas nitroreducens TaxID=1236968 RepID=A0A5A7N3B8_9PROT|nr:putative secreted protein [alpha proteobacterium Q-1]GER02771.1 hypothetical protein JCM17846_04530 [Iodidimonas nitroreducens]
MLKYWIASLFLFLALPVHAQEGQTADRLTVVELFSSQGCPNCPPAYKLLSDISKEDGILALNWPVDYWDYLGWRDDHARRAYSDHQRAYNQRLGEPGVYTPQMVIDGRLETVGSRRKAVVQKIGQARDLARQNIDVTLQESEEACFITLPDLENDERKIFVRAVFYRTETIAAISRGDNEGKTLNLTNLVRASLDLGPWSGDKEILSVPMIKATESGADHMAVILHADDENGPIIGAARIRLSSAGV